MPDGASTIASLQQLRVLQIGLEWFAGGSAGGASRVMSDLVRTLPEAGIRVRGAVVAPSDVATLTDGCVQSFARDNASLPQRLLGARKAVRQLLRHEQIDLVAAHFALYAVPWLDQLGRVPLVMHFHGPWAAESRLEGAGWASVAAKGALERMVYRRAARIIVLSQAFADLACNDYGIDRAKVRVIPGSVDLARFAVAETPFQDRDRLGWPVDRKVLFSVRRLAARMGLDRLIAAMPDIVRHHPSAVLFIAGRGPREAELRQQTARLGLADHVRFLGFLPDADLPLAYRAADINLVPTIDLEGFGLTAAEALAAGTPSMVTPVGGLPEVVAGLSRGLVFRSNSASDIAGGVCDALNDKLALPAASDCVAYAARHFSFSRQALAVAAVYREVC
jgi:glycosyltransferase involved in cell wall biosynthesis